MIVWRCGWKLFGSGFKFWHLIPGIALTFSSRSSRLDALFLSLAQSRLLWLFVTKALRRLTHTRTLRSLIKNQSRISYDRVHDDSPRPHRHTQLRFLLSFGFRHSSYSDSHLAPSPFEPTSISGKLMSFSGPVVKINMLCTVRVWTSQL